MVIATSRVDIWLTAAVQSMLDQNEVDLELIVVHDGILIDPKLEWTHDRRITNLHLPDRSGPGAAAVVGLRAARSALIARLDSDDLSLPGRLTTQLNVLNAAPEMVLVGSRAIRIDDHGSCTGTIRCETGSDIRRHLLSRNEVIHSSVMFRKSAYAVAGGYNTTLRQMEDYDLWLRMATQGRIAVLPEPLVAYRVHASQTSRGARPFGPYVSAVSRSRRALSQYLGEPCLKQRVRNLRWRGSQYLRYYGLRPPGYSV